MKPFNKQSNAKIERERESLVSEQKTNLFSMFADIVKKRGTNEQTLRLLYITFGYATFLCNKIIWILSNKKERKIDLKKSDKVIQSFGKSRSKSETVKSERNPTM